MASEGVERFAFASSPYQQLRQCASSLAFRECSSSTTSSSNNNDNGEGGADKASSFFCSKVEEALDYCFHRSVPKLVLTRNDTFAHWLVDWKPIVDVIEWEDLFLDHDHKSSTAGALKEVCHAIQKVAWIEHSHRLNLLFEFYKVPNDCNLPEQECQNWSKAIEQFHDAQLRALQQMFLDLWIESEHNATIKDSITPTTTNQCHKEISDSPTLRKSDRFMFHFIADEVTRPFLQSPGVASSYSSITASTANGSAIDIWRNLIQQYTQSLCHDIQTLVHPSKLDPIANILSANPKQLDKGDDVYTRIAILRMMMSKIRRWAEILTGLQVHEYVGPGNEMAVPIATSSEEQDILFVVSSEALNDLLERLNTLGALKLPSSEEKQKISAKSPPLDVIRLIEKSSWKRVEITKKRTRKRSKKNINKLPCSVQHSDEEQILECCLPRKASITARCIIKGCRNFGQLSDGGMCKPHICQCSQPYHPFQWTGIIPHEIGIQIMKRLRRRGLTFRDNVHNAIINEVRLMQQLQQKRAKLKV